jgi:hypothetical protein
MRADAVFSLAGHPSIAPDFIACVAIEGAITHAFVEVVTRIHKSVEVV